MAGNGSTPEESSPKLKFTTAVGHGLAKALNIELEEDALVDPITRGESVYSMSSAPDMYYEPEPTVLEWFQQFCPTLHGFGEYMVSLVPFLTWIHRYNLKWAYGDLVAYVYNP